MIARGARPPMLAFVVVAALAAGLRGEVSISPSPSPSAAVSPATAPAAPATQAAAQTDIGKLPLKRTQPKPATDGGQMNIPAPTFDPARVAVALVAVIGLILFLRWGSRKLLALPAGGTSSHLMQVVARTTLAPRQQLLLVRVGKRMLVIGDSGGRLTGVGQIDDPDEVAAMVGQAQSTQGRSTVGGFSQAMKRLGQRFGAQRSVEVEGEQVAAQFADDRGLFTESSIAGDDIEPHDDADSVVTSEKEKDDAPSESRDESAARAAVEAARVDILALRARLQQISGRMGDAPGASANGSTA